MRDLCLLDLYRERALEREYYGTRGDSTCGVFSVPSPIDKARLAIVASSGDGWDHVSVSRPNRPPNWRELEHVKRLFFKDDEWAMQLHAPPASHISVHPHTLHLWRPQNERIPTPPTWMV